MAELLVKQSVHIKASAERIWRVLTDPDLTQRYMYGCRTVSDWNPRTALLWEGIADGKKVVYVKGTILEIEPPRLLRFTVFDPHAAYEDTPANYLWCTYSLTPGADGVRLDVVQGDYANVADGQKRYEHTVAGGDALLQQIKALAEER
jgi:uncharacterized protein YndB with AHSA1/START domain